jgi:hypothetical protein
MPRPKSHHSSTDIDAQIRRLEQERERLVVLEDQRRGAIIRDCLNGKSADSIRTVLEPIVNPRDAALFGISRPLNQGTSKTAARPTGRPAREQTAAPG